MELSLNEFEFVRRAVKEGIRLDKRKISEFRPLNVQPGNKNGQVMVRLGDTKVYCSVTADIVVPPTDRPFEGALQIFVEIFPGAHSPDTSSQDLDLSRLSLQRLLERSIKMSRSIDTESLCILPGQRVWSVRVDVHILDDDGCAGDAALIAAMASLQSFKRPCVEVVDGEVKVFTEFDRHPVPLTVMHCPLPASFSFLGGEDNDAEPITLCDPTTEEEKALDGCMTIVLNKQGELVTALKAGGLPLSTECIANNCMNMARERSQIIYNSIMQSVGK